MNTAGSVAYGWGALIVAAGVAFYFAKKDINARRLDQQYRGQRPTEKLSWQDRIASNQTSGSPRDPAKESTPLKKEGGVMAELSASMKAKPTGVDTPHKSATSDPRQHQ